ncbi:MAG: hypothetical protein BYD32DRAFT_413660 [Podila humilis]|nr:MAG: hypothetical protein BYD32DRAFT_413660 [Podila humilis]
MTTDVQVLVSIINALGVPKKIPSHPPKYRRAAVAIIIRIRPDHAQSAHDSKPRNRQPQQPSQSKQPPYLDVQPPESLDEFFAQPWVQSGVPEILFIERANRRPTDHRWTGHVALPGGKQVSSLDGGDQETAARETTEEIGLDLADPTLFRCVGQLDDRELWTSFGRVFLMVLAPFVYLQLTPKTPPLKPQPDQVASVHWQPLSLFLDRLAHPQWTPMVINLSNKLAPRFSRTILRPLLGTMALHSIEMPYKPEFILRYQQELIKDTSERHPHTPYTALHAKTHTVAVVDHDPDWDLAHRPLKLWGLTLQMLADLLELKDGPIQLDIRHKVWDSGRMRRRLDAGHLPGFSMVDMHFWVRALLKFHSWQQTEKNKPSQSNRVGSWESYYRMVKQAFVCVVLGRAAAVAVLVKLLKVPMLRMLQTSVVRHHHKVIKRVP